MSEWLGKSRIEKEDIQKVQPSMVEFFPVLTRYYTDNQKMRVLLVLPYEKGERFKKAIISTYGAFSPTNVRKAAEEALDKWLDSHK